MLKEYCKKRGVIATDVASQNGISYSTLSRWYCNGNFELIDKVIKKTNRANSGLVHYLLSRNVYPREFFQFSKTNRKTLERWFRKEELKKLNEEIENFKLLRGIQK